MIGSGAYILEREAELGLTGCTVDIGTVDSHVSEETGGLGEEPLAEHPRHLAEEAVASCEAVQGDVMGSEFRHLHRCIRTHGTDPRIVGLPRT